MARIALIAGLALAGAFISVATGGLGTFAVGAWASDIIAGAAVGAAAGSVLSNIIFPPNQNSAPPMNDLQAMSSAYGTPIPWGYGGYRIAGQVIWAQTIQVQKNQQSSGGGKGGGPTSTVYTYTISAAISFGFGPGSIIRIWADSKLIYDKRNKGPIAIDTGLSTSAGNAITTPFNPTFYNGTSTQSPDPTIQAAQGINATSGYRDQILMVLTDFPLADYGNRLPNFRAEITASTGMSYVKNLYPGSSLPSPIYGTVYPPAFTQVDAVNRIGYTASEAGDVIQKVDLDAISGTPAIPWQNSTAYSLGNQVLDSNGNVQYCIRAHTSQSSGTPTWATGEGVQTYASGDYRWLNVGPGPDVNPVLSETQLKWPDMTSYSGVELLGTCSGPDTGGHYWAQVYRSGTGVTGQWMARFNTNTWACEKLIKIPDLYVFTGVTKVKSSTTGKNYLYCTTSHQLLVIIDADAASIVAQGTFTPTGYAIGYANVEGCPAVDPKTGIAYVACNLSAGVCAVVAVDIRSGVATQLWTSLFDATDFGDSYANQQLDGLLWDAGDNTIIVLGDQGAIIKLSSKNGSIITYLPTGTIVGAPVGMAVAHGYDCLVPSNGNLVFQCLSPVNSVQVIRTSDLTIQQTVPTTNWMPGISSGAFVSSAYDPLTNSMFFGCYGTVYQGVTARFYLDRQAVAEATLQAVVEDIWARTGADASLLDASALSSIMVKGYPVTQQGTGKGLLGPLMAAYFFDLVESDNVLKAVVRGQAVSTVIPEDDLGTRADNYEANPTFIQEHDLPLFINVTYYDIDRDYQQGMQTYRRSKRTKKTRNQTTISLPLSMQKDDAAVLAAKCMQTAWAERNQWEYKLWKMNYLVIDPTDVVQFQYNGALYESRIGKTSIGANKIIEVTAVSEDPKQYVSTATGAPSDGFVSAVIAPLAQSLLFILDIPFLTDSDNEADGITGFYWLMGPSAANTSWPGGILLDSTDNNTFAPLSQTTSPAATGTVLAATPEPTSPFSWDRSTIINVVMANGAVLASAPLLDVLAGSNWFYFGGEVGAFANATLQADGSYNLDTLLRGLRGTEAACKTHIASETFVMLDTAKQRQTVTAAAINTEQYFRGVTLGQPATAGASVPTTLSGADLKPYAPALFTASIDGSYNINVSWVRRTRIGGAWLDGTGTVPLSEESESYDLEIYNSAGTVLKRTVAGLNTPTYTYTAAQQTTDFGSYQPYVYAKVYQNSAAVGRGFPTTNPTLGAGGVVSGGSDASSILGVSITGTPADGDVLQYNSSTGNWEIVGPVLKRQAIAKTTASLGNGVAETGSITVNCKSFALLQVEVSAAARVELYSTAALRDADASRAYNTPPAAGSQNGILCDMGLMAGGDEKWVCSPPLLGANMDSTPGNVVYYRITNLSGGALAVTATITIVPIEL